MNLAQVAAPALGAVTILANTATLTLSISFAVVFEKQDAPKGIPAIVASSIGVLGLGSVVMLVYRQIRYRNRSQEGQLRGWRWRRLSEAAGLFSLLNIVVTFATYLWMKVRQVDLPSRVLGAPLQVLLSIAFILWGVAVAAHALFVLIIMLLDRQAAQRNGTLHVQDSHPVLSSEMRETSLRLQTVPRTPPMTSSKESASDDSRTSTWSSRKRSGSDTVASFRSSITHVVRPISSKTRLITQSQKYRPTSLDSGTGEREIIEDGFDSWDTSAVDPQSRQTVMNSSVISTNTSPTPPRFLETIPASPTGSRSPSPGFPLDLEPPPFANRRRSRSHSPSLCNSSHNDRTASPAPTGESHIHPLFRSDSPTPPPSATPGTVVTAAPNAGQLIPLSGRNSLHRMRSGSLPTSSSPLAHSSSLDDIGRMARSPLSPVEMTDDETESEGGRDSPPVREMTPPIPDWILGAGPRSSLTGYARRKTGGLVAVGEEGS